MFYERVDQYDESFNTGEFYERYTLDWKKGKLVKKSNTLKEYDNYLKDEDTVTAQYDVTYKKRAYYVKNKVIYTVRLNNNKAAGKPKILVDLRKIKEFRGKEKYVSDLAIVNNRTIYLTTSQDASEISDGYREDKLYEIKLY